MLSNPHAESGNVLAAASRPTVVPRAVSLTDDVPRQMNPRRPDPRASVQRLLRTSHTCASRTATAWRLQVWTSAESGNIEFLLRLAVSSRDALFRSVNSRIVSRPARTQRAGTLFLLLPKYGCP